ncbi:MAG: hypothetical protein VKO39_12805 [Cyanobacteriota bacterium]|nr:hypothetical protein [Cyanobacteriota bacterium]
MTAIGLPSSAGTAATLAFDAPGWIRATCSASTSLAAWRQSSWPVTAADRPQVVADDNLGLVAV